jgi:hypothetical protein
MPGSMVAPRKTACASPERRPSGRDDRETAAIGFAIGFGAVFYGGYYGSPYYAHGGNCVLRRRRVVNRWDHRV